MAAVAALLVVVGTMTGHQVIQEYELKLTTSRTENGRVFVRFSLVGGGAQQDVMVVTTEAMSRATTRKIADLKDQAGSGKTFRLRNHRSCLSLEPL